MQSNTIFESILEELGKTHVSIKNPLWMHMVNHDSTTSEIHKRHLKTHVRTTSLVYAHIRILSDK